MKVYVWGTGCGAGDLIDRGLDPSEISAFLDGEGRGGSFLGRPVIGPEALQGADFDLVLVASRQAEAIAAKAEELGLPREKLLFLKNNWTLKDRNLSYEAAARVLPRELLEELRRPGLPMREPLWLEQSPLTARDLENDCVRLRSLEAICRRLSGVPGDAAELGVYRGVFARCINALLPERQLWLFDSFSGFDEEEARHQAAGLVEAHRLTDGEKVLSLLPHPERAVIRKGFFPERRRGWRNCALPWSPWTRIWKRVRWRACAGSGPGFPRAEPCCCMTGPIPGCRVWQGPWSAMRQSLARRCRAFLSATCAAPWC